MEIEQDILRVHIVGKKYTKEIDNKKAALVAILWGCLPRRVVSAQEVYTPLPIEC